VVREVVIFRFVFGELETMSRIAVVELYCGGLEIIWPCLDVGISYDGLLNWGLQCFCYVFWSKLAADTYDTLFHVKKKVQYNIVSLSFRAQVLLF